MPYHAPNWSSDRNIKRQRIKDCVIQSILKRATDSTFTGCRGSNLNACVAGYYGLRRPADGQLRLLPFTDKRGTNSPSSKIRRRDVHIHLFEFRDAILIRGREVGDGCRDTGSWFGGFRPGLPSLHPSEIGGMVAGLVS